MANVELYDYQLEAINKLHSGCVLYGGTGVGKSRTALAYIYLKEMHGQLKINGKGETSPPKNPIDIYIITTAKKRDSHEWEGEMLPFMLSTDPGIKVTIDSWNNIKKYNNIYGAFFIFDEQRVTGKGAWVKSFYKITKKNKWILLTATPGDTWNDYVPLFIANGYFKNRSEFNAHHVVFKPYLSFPEVDYYVNEGILNHYRHEILVPMISQREIEKIKKKVDCDYDRRKYKTVFKDRWDIYENKPIEETGKLCYLLRRVVNEDPTRPKAIMDILRDHPKAIIFYNYNPELAILRSLAKKLHYKVAEWNGEKHEPLPSGKAWIYLCQYASACEGWNCITTDTIIFYSLNYSYKIMKQAEGRIDRANTPYKTLYYFYLESYAPIDISIKRALSMKRKFNEKAFLKGSGR